MESCLIDYSDYENAPGGLATFGGFFCDFLATLAATMIFKKWSATIDYDQGKIREKSTEKIFQISGEKLADFFGFGMTATVEPCRPGSRPDCAERANAAVVVQLATPGKRPVQALNRPCNSGIMCRLCHDGARKTTQADNIGRWQWGTTEK